MLIWAALGCEAATSKVAAAKRTFHLIATLQGPRYHWGPIALCKALITLACGWVWHQDFTIAMFFWCTSTSTTLLPVWLLNQPLIHAEKSRDIAGDIARYWSHVNSPMSIMTWAFATAGSRQTANVVLINRTFIFFILLDLGSVACCNCRRIRRTAKTYGAQRIASARLRWPTLIRAAIYDLEASATAAMYAPAQRDWLGPF